MRRFTLVPLAGAITASLIAGATAAQPPGTRLTRDFVQAAAQTDQFEIMEATTALAQSQDLQVRAFAQAMIQAHKQTMANLKAAAATTGLDQPKSGLSGDQSAFLASLQSQRGADFDKTYVRQQMLVHHAALAVIQSYAGAGDNPAIRQAAAAALLIVQSHLDMLSRMRAADRSPQ